MRTFGLSKLYLSGIVSSNAMRMFRITNTLKMTYLAIIVRAKLILMSELNIDVYQKSRTKAV